MSTAVLDEIVNFRSRFREERLRLGYKNQTDLAQKLSLNVKTVNMYETGKSSPGVEDLLRFGELGADLCYLLTGRRLPFADQSQTAHATHVVALVDTLVGLKLSAEDARMLNDLALRLGR